MNRLARVALPAVVLTLVACFEPHPLGPSSMLAERPILLAWGPATPNFNLEVVLRATTGTGFGLVKFRQPKDDAFIVHLDTWVRDLAPNHGYHLQRAVDLVVDDDCTSADWLTLGQGLTPFAIITDDRGTGSAALWRAVPMLPGTEFDIHFRVVDDVSGNVALQSECYQYQISM